MKVWVVALAALLVVSIAAPAAAQSSHETRSASAEVAGPAVSSPGQDVVLAQIRELRLMLDSLRDELVDSRRESDALRREVQAVREQLEGLQPERAARTGGDKSVQGRLDALGEDQELLGAKVDDLEQSKVESGSRQHVRLSGLALLNLIGTHGVVDNLDVPVMAVRPNPGESGGSVGASVRQSFVTLEVFGPTLAGGVTTGSMTFDFFGGFPSTRDGIGEPLVRLRTAKAALDWKAVSIVGGQESPFFAPRSPTSLASTAYPALSSAGNLWTWTPQVHVDRRFELAGGSIVTVQGGILDPFSGELPTLEYARLPTAGERSGLPAEAGHIGWQRSAAERAPSLGAGVYYSRQNWGFDRLVNGWAATADWDVPLGSLFSVAGQIYRGRAMAGLGGSAAPSVAFDGTPALATTTVLPIETAGGWSQLKFKPTGRIEFNGSYGEDRPFFSGSARLVESGALDADAPSRNAAGLINGIYQARSNLFFSLEYHRLWTSTFGGSRRTADRFSLTTGIAF